MNKMFKRWLHWVIVALSFLSFGISHAETYYLKRIESPEKDGRSSMIVADPRDAGYMTTITIRDKRILVNESDGCDIDIVRINPFGISRVQTNYIDEWGGEKKFNNFLKRKLNTSLKEWKTRISSKVNSNTDLGPCMLIERSAMITADKKLILWGGVNFYLFELGKDLGEYIPMK